MRITHKVIIPLFNETFIDVSVSYSIFLKSLEEKALLKALEHHREPMIYSADLVSIRLFELLNSDRRVFPYGFAN